jgi:hypothetical protein
MKKRNAGTLSLARAVWIAGLLTVTVAATAQASSINYEIHNNGGLLANNEDSPGANTPVSITGRFAYDTSTMAITEFDMTVTTEAPFNGTFTDDSQPYFEDSLLYVYPIMDGRTNFFFEIALDANFGKPGESNIDLVDVVFPPHIPGLPSTTFILLPTDYGSLPFLVGFENSTVGDPLAATPEPATWAMVLAAFAGAAAWMRARRQSTP